MDLQDQLAVQALRADKAQLAPEVTMVPLGHRLVVTFAIFFFSFAN